MFAYMFLCLHERFTIFKGSYRIDDRINGNALFVSDSTLSVLVASNDLHDTMVHFMLIELSRRPEVRTMRDLCEEKNI